MKTMQSYTGEAKMNRRTQNNDQSKHNILKSMCMEK